MKAGGSSKTLPPTTTPTAPKAISRLKRHTLQMETWKIPASSRSKVLIDHLRMAAGGAAAGEGLGAGVLEDLCSKAKDPPSAPVRCRCQLSKARVINYKETAHL